MATVEEVLNDMSTADVIGSAANIEYLIDNELRIITVPQNGVVLGVEGDKDVNVVHFKMPRMYRGLDLGDGFNIRVNYANAKAELGYFAVVHPDVTEDSISFEWLLGSHALMYVGEIKFAVSLIKSSVDGRIEKKFNTTLGKAQCLTGLDVDVSVPEEDIYDLLTQIKQDVMADIQPSLDGAKADAAAAKQSATQAAESAATASTGAENVRLGVEAVKDAVKIAEQTSAHVDEVKTAVVTAQGKAEAAKTSAEQFKMAAEQAKNDATAQAQAAAQSAEAATQAKNDANTSKTSAAESAKQAKASQDASAASAQTASTKAGEASASAQTAKGHSDTASAKAAEAKTSADAAKVSETNAKAAENAATSIVENAKVVSDNVLKGEKTGTLVNVTDAWPSKLRGMKIYGQSNQVTTTGKNLINGMESFYNASESPSNLRNYCWGYSLGQNPLKLTKPLKPGTYTFSLYVDNVVSIYFSQSPYSGTNEMFSINKKLPNDIRNGLNRYYETVELKNESDIVGIYSDYGACCCGMLNEGTEPLPYEPYTGGKPSPSPEYPQEITNLNKAEISVMNKNIVELDDKVATTQGVELTVKPDGHLTLNGTVGSKGIWFNIGSLHVIEGQTYTLSLNKAYDAFGVSAWSGTDSKHVLFVAAQYKKVTATAKKTETLAIHAVGNTYATFDNEVVSIQVEISNDATEFSPHKSKITAIDLKANELCSLPDGVKDEVVIDVDGNVSLIKRTWQVEKRIGDMNNTENFPGWKFTDNELKDYVGDGVDVEIIGRSTHFDRFFANTSGPTSGGAIYTVNRKQSELISKYPEEIVRFVGLRNTPQTIPLGKIDMPALPESTSNVWNDGNIPANVYIQYLKDVNIAYADLEAQIKQLTASVAANTLEIATK